MYNWKQISPQQTSFIKGIGMLLILFHNYFHQISPWSGENEFEFTTLNVTSFVILVKEYPLDILRLVFAFMGHYGVQLFIFLSGYGLFLSYRNKSISWLPFIKKRLTKLYPVYFISVCLFLVLHIVFAHKFHPYPTSTLMKYAGVDLLFLQNFIPGLAFELVGPWWFFSLIVQLYIVFPFIMGSFRKWGIKAIIVTGLLAMGITYFLNPYLGNLGYNLYFLFIGRLPEFCLGILFAWMGNFKLSWWVISLSFAVLVLGNIFELLWPFTMLSATISLLVLTNFIGKITLGSKNLSAFILWVGANSLFIFSVHGFLRGPFIRRAEIMDNPFITILLSLGFLLVSLLVAGFVKIMDNQLQNKIKKLQLVFPKRRLRHT